MPSISIKELQRIEGIVLWHEDDLVVRSVGRNIEVSHDNGRSFSDWCSLPCSTSTRIASWLKLGNRLLRANPKHLVRTADSHSILFDKNMIWSAELGSDNVAALSKVHGSRPLRLATFDNKLAYGEYFSNPDRQPVHIWQSADAGRSWQSVITFDEIRHVHGVFVDPIDASIWVTTGDLDSEAAIWRFERDFSGGKRIVYGSQMARAIDLIFTGDHVFFGSDAPDRPNAIFRLVKSSGETELLQNIEGPAFHARDFFGHLIFTTACEPSKINTYPFAQLWVSSDGDSWSSPLEFKKDWWSMKYFQYGQILLPSGAGSELGFWISPFATKYDQQSFFVPFALL